MIPAGILLHTTRGGTRLVTGSVHEAGATVLASTQR